MQNWQETAESFLKCVGITALVLGASGMYAANRPAFEAAAIKPVPQESGPFGNGMSGEELSQDSYRPPTAEFQSGNFPIVGRRVTIRDRSLRAWIALANGVRISWVFGPEWISGAHFALDAKVAESDSPALVRKMLTTLLEDRFALKTHEETRTLPGYELLRQKGDLRLRNAEPDKLPVQPDFARPRTFPPGTFPTQVLRLNGISMPQLADDLSGPLNGPVIDLTGLDGSYDIELEITRAPFRPEDVRPDTVAAIMADSAFEGLKSGLEKLGLTIRRRAKTPVKVLVVDSISRFPTAN